MTFVKMQNQMEVSPRAASVFSSNFSPLLKDTSFDLEIILNDDTTLQVHSIVICQGSDLLRALVAQAARPATSAVAAQLHLNVDEPDAFPEFIKFLYSKELPSKLTTAQILSLVVLAEQFDVESLKSIMEQTILSRFDSLGSLSDDDMYLALQLLNRNRFGAVTDAIINLAASHASTLFRQPFALDIEPDVLHTVLKCPKLRVSSVKHLSAFVKRFLALHPDERRFARFLEPSSICEVHLDPTGISSSIACFFADGSTKYNEMTQYAIKTFLQTTPEVFVGLLTHDEATRDFILNGVPTFQHFRVLWKKTSPREFVPNWNQTQYKLDIIQFAQDKALGFQNIFWFDSDTISFEDNRPFMIRFASQQECQLYFTPDHVMRSESFKQRWRLNWPLFMVPQACIMGFKSEIMPEFFNVWIDKWHLWTQPHPFAYVPDPNPEFAGSAFCTEQYALGMALNKPQFSSKVMLFHRHLVIAQRNSSDKNCSSVSMQHTPASSTHVADHWAEEARGVARQQDHQKSTRVFVVPSDLVLQSQYFESLPAEEPPTISTSANSALPKEQAKYAISSLTLINENISGFSSQSSPSVIGSVPVPPGSVVADMFGGSILHTYNQNYNTVKIWFNKPNWLEN